MHLHVYVCVWACVHTLVSVHMYVYLCVCLLKHQRKLEESI